MASKKSPKRKLGRPRIHSVDWRKVGLGKRPDSIVARELGVPATTVTYHRLQLKIPSFSWA